jgi:hypothetical protein
MHRAYAGAILLAFGCGKPFWTSPPTPRQLSTKDQRQALVGTWNIQFAFDSVRRIVRTKDGAASRAKPLLAPQLAAVLELRDTLTDVDGTRLVSTLQFDSAQVPQAAMDWFDRDTVGPVLPNPSAIRTTTVERHGSHVTLMFNGVVCCFFVSGVYRGDSIVGTWRRVVELGIGVTGHLTMTRPSP